MFKFGKSFQKGKHMSTKMSKSYWIFFYLYSKIVLKEPGMGIIAKSFRFCKLFTILAIPKIQI